LATARRITVQAAVLDGFGEMFGGDAGRLIEVGDSARDFAHAVKRRVRTARAKGLTERSVIVRHATRNALLPVVTIIGLQLGALLSGAVLTETVFNLSGVGRTMFEAITGRDYVVMASDSYHGFGIGRWQDRARPRHPFGWVAPGHVNRLDLCRGQRGRCGHHRARPAPGLAQAAARMVRSTERC
jgi:hypothetical protein